MLDRYGLLLLFLCNLVRFGGYERDEFDAAFDQELSGVAGEGNAVSCGTFVEVWGGEDLGYDLLDCC